MWIRHYLEQYIMPFLNPTCNMDVNYRGKHKHKSSKILKKIKNKPLKNLKYKESKILKLKDIVTISNLKFVHDQVNKILQSFWIFFINKTRHLYNTTGNSLDVSRMKTMTYGSNSFTLHAISTWNFFQNKLQHHYITP